MMFIKALSVFVFIRGCVAPPGSPCSAPPVLVWPLGQYIESREILSNTVSGTLGSVTYGLGVPAVGNYSALYFGGTSDSFVDIGIPLTPCMSLDYSVMFYVKFQNKATPSTLVHYRSDTAVASTVNEFIISVSAGDITITHTNYGSGIWATNANIVNGQWHHIIYERDVSRNVAKLYLDRKDLGDKSFASQLANSVTTSPGLIRMAGKHDGTSSFNGFITCLQVAPCKVADTPSLYDPKCQPASWPTTTSTTAAPTTTPTTTTTTPTTTTTTPTTTTTTSTTTTTATTTTPSTTTTTPTTRTTTSTTTTAATTTTPSTTTTTPTTTTTTSTTTTAATTTTTFTTYVPTAAPDIRPGCHHYTKTHPGFTFANPLDVINVLTVPTNADCALECNRHVDCSMFATVSAGPTNYECKVGILTSSTAALSGSLLYTRQ